MGGVRSMSSASPGQPGTKKCALLASRRTGSPLRIASGLPAGCRTSTRHAMAEVSTARAANAAAKPAMPAASGFQGQAHVAPDLRRESTVLTSGSIEHQSADTDRTTTLCADSATDGTAANPRTAGRQNLRHRCNAGMPRCAHICAILGNRFHTADLVVHPHHRNQCDLVVEQRRQGHESTRPSASTGILSAGNPSWTRASAGPGLHRLPRSRHGAWALRAMPMTALSWWCLREVNTMSAGFS